ncbi:hypothetical protein FKP32DRAFT_385590 [Trametes sanguinea]|nr:hypothetical protein FKP32DRAFT_385590 [Trametes sanguinea]
MRACRHAPSYTAEHQLLRQSLDRFQPVPASPAAAILPPASTYVIYRNRTTSPSRTRWIDIRSTLRPQRLAVCFDGCRLQQRCGRGTRTSRTSWPNLPLLTRAAQDRGILAREPNGSPDLLRIPGTVAGVCFRVESAVALRCGSLKPPRYIRNSREVLRIANVPTLHRSLDSGDSDEGFPASCRSVRTRRNTSIHRLFTGAPVRPGTLHKADVIQNVCVVVAPVKFDVGCAYNLMYTMSLPTDCLYLDWLSSRRIIRVQACIMNPAVRGRNRVRDEFNNLHDQANCLSTQSVISCCPCDHRHDVLHLPRDGQKV